MPNAYQTNDPGKLLELKRLEAAALLDVIRTINHYEHPIPSLCRIAQNVLRAQLGVKKLAFFYQGNNEWEEGFYSGFPTFQDAHFEEMVAIRGVQAISKAMAPQLAALGVEYVVTISNRDEVFAYFLVAKFADSEVEAQNDLIFIETLGNILAVGIQNKLLFQEKVRQEFLRKELEVAATIQQQLLIADFTRFRKIDVFGLNRSHHGIGGDFFDVIKKGKGTTFVCIADVSGKGIGAALLMSNLQANLRALCAQYDAPADIIRELNRILLGITTGEKFVTLFLARIDTDLGSFTYVNAGHNYPVFLHHNQPRRLDTGCMLLGIIPDVSPVEGNLTFSPGDILFMFTDGVVEQSNPQEVMYGSERIVDTLIERKEESSQALVHYFAEDVTRFAEGREVTDDVTMLCVKFLPETK